MTILKKLALVIWVCSFSTNPLYADDNTTKKNITLVLDSFHHAAAKADWETYFNHISDQGYFIGTDVSERWDKKTFQKYASGSQGWVYHLRRRDINLTPDGKSAWFHEILESETYGTSRGTGVMIRTNLGWKIAQYHLTFPIPNDLSEEFTQKIQAFEKK